MTRKRKKSRDHRRTIGISERKISRKSLRVLFLEGQFPSVNPHKGISHKNTKTRKTYFTERRSQPGGLKFREKRRIGIGIRSPEQGEKVAKSEFCPNRQEGVFPRIFRRKSGNFYALGMGRGGSGRKSGSELFGAFWDRRFGRLRDAENEDAGEK